VESLFLKQRHGTRTKTSALEFVLAWQIKTVYLFVTYKQDAFYTAFHNTVPKYGIAV